MGLAAAIGDSADDQLEAFRNDVIAGLLSRPKTLPSRWLYDDRGSELFEEITRLEDYYPTRTETALLQDHAADLAAFCGAGASIIEYGAGAGIKTQILLAALEAPHSYVPIDIAGDFLELSARRLHERFPNLPVVPVVGDFTEPVELPDRLDGASVRVGFFPGSTLGNLGTETARRFLMQVRRHVGAGGRALIGIDLVKSIDVLLRAYDDSEGVTAAFNLNLLERINRELGGDFNCASFRHDARWNADESAVEMHLVSLAAQQVSVADCVFSFEVGETIHTESSRKYEITAFNDLASACGWRPDRLWTDRDDAFAVVGLTAA